jgi:hypothetical protein
MLIYFSIVVNRKELSLKINDEGITNGPSIFAYLVFGPGEKPAQRLHEARKAQHTDLE